MYIYTSSAYNTVRVKMKQFVKKNLHRFLIRNRAPLLWFASGFVQEVPGYGLQRFLPNAPQFGECATFSRQKVPQSLDCGTLQDSALWRGHQSAALFGGRKVAHMPPCFQVPLQRVCCILFDPYRIY